MKQALHCDASHATQLTDRLEGAGLVARVADPTDRRVRQLRLTSKGALRRAELIAASHADSPALAPLTPVVQPVIDFVGERPLPLDDYTYVLGAEPGRREQLALLTVFRSRPAAGDSGPGAVMGACQQPRA